MRGLALFGLAVALAAPVAAQDVPSFGAVTEAVHVDVWVGREGQPLRGLTAADFEVKDRGVPQQVELLDVKETPVHAILLLDSSYSLNGSRLETLKGAARAFLDGLGPKDRVSLLSFSHAVRLAGPVAGDVATARAALDGLVAHGATALHDAVFAALQLADNRHGRPVVLVFSDGEDVVSWLSSEDVEAVAKESEAAIYVVDTAGTVQAVQVRPTLEQILPLDYSRRGNTASQTSRPPELPQEHRGTRFQRVDTPAFLRRIAAASGGQVWHGGTQTEGLQADGTRQPPLAEAFLKVVAEIKNRYLLRFEPQGPPQAGWHELEVKLRGQKAEVRARRGYLRVASQG